MIILDENQKKALTEWIVYELSNLKCDAKQVELLNKYIHALIKMGSPTDKIKNSLREFLDDRTDYFVDALQDRLNRKDFSVKKEEPSAPPKDPAPPPKQQESTQKQQTQQSAKSSISESKKEAKPISKVKSESLNPTEKTTKKDEIISNSSKTEKDSKSHYQTKPHSSTQNQAKSQPRNQQQQQQKSQQSNHQQPQQNTQHQKTSQVNSLFDEEDLINDDYDEEQQSDGAVEKVSDEKIVSKNIEPAPRYIIFIAGIDRNNASIQTLFSLFTKYGRILAIEVNEDEKVAYIEFEELLSAFKAIKANNKKNLFKNTAIRIDYAIPPDPEKLEELEVGYNIRKQQRQERKQQMLQQQLEQQQKESESKSANNDVEAILEEEDQIKKHIIQKIKDTNEQIKNCTDPAQMEKLKQTLDEYQSMFSEVY